MLRNIQIKPLNVRKIFQKVNLYPLKIHEAVRTFRGLGLENFYQLNEYYVDAYLNASDNVIYITSVYRGTLVI